MIKRFAALAAVCLLLGFSGVAFAAETTVDLGAAFGSVSSLLQTVVVSGLLLGAGWLSYLLHKNFNVQIDLAHNEIVQRAAQNAAGRLLNSLENSLQGKTVDLKSPMVAALAKSVIEAVPTARARFGLSDEDVAKMILGKLPQVANTTTPPAGA